MQPQDILKALYDSEINCRIESHWDGGWTGWLGDEMNVFTLEHVRGQTLAECLAELANQACSVCPASAFAERYGRYAQEVVRSRAAKAKKHRQSENDAFRYAFAQPKVTFVRYIGSQERDFRDGPRSTIPASAQPTGVFCCASVRAG